MMTESKFNVSCKIVQKNTIHFSNFRTSVYFIFSASVIQSVTSSMPTPPVVNNAHISPSAGNYHKFSNKMTVAQ